MNNLFFIYLACLLISHFVLIKRDKIATYLNLIDKPDNYRKIHKNYVPMVGGIYIFLSTFLFFLLFNILIDNYQARFILSFLSILTSLFIIGLLDDILKISSLTRIFLVLIATLLSCSLTKDFQINSIYLSFFKPDIPININIFFTVFCILVFNIATNLSDGTNGVTASINLVWLIFFSFLIFNFDKNFNLIILLVIINLLIFIIYNLKSKCFLGSAGCNVLTGITAFTAIYLNNLGKVYSDTIFIFFLIPGLDMCRVIISRILEKKNPFSPDRNHLHHLLEKIINKNLVFLIYSLFVVFCCVSTLKFPTYNIFIIAIIFFLYSSLIFYLKSLRN